MPEPTAQTLRTLPGTGRVSCSWARTTPSSSSTRDGRMPGSCPADALRTGSTARRGSMPGAVSPAPPRPGSGTRACWLSSRKPIFSLICGVSRAEVPSSSPCSPPSFCSLCCSSCSAGSTASATAAGMAATAPCPFPRWYTGPSSGGTGPAAGGTGGGTRRLLRPRPAGAPEVQAPVPPQASSATATYTLEISYQTAKSTLPVWGRWKIFWNSVTASWVAGP